MTGLYIFLTVLAVLLLLLISPVTICFSYDKEYKMSVSYLFVKLRFSKESLQNKQIKKSKKQRLIAEKKPDYKKKKNKFIPNAKDMINDKGVAGFIYYVVDVLGILFNKCKNILKHTKVKRFRLAITVSSDDAASTATEYGYVCTVLYPFLGAAAQLMEFKEMDVTVHPAYDGAKQEIWFYTRISLCPIFALTGIISGFYEFLSLTISNKQMKGGAVNE